MNGTSARYPAANTNRIEWVTLGLILTMWMLWGLSVLILPAFSVLLAALCLVLSLVLHASLTHEVCHGHPFPSRRASEALVVINPGLFIPYHRFRDTHLAHHQDSILTDPYDDPESNYLDPAKWQTTPWWLKTLRRMNNTLAGRILIGPTLGQVSFMLGDWRAVRRGDGQVLKSWMIHVVGLVPVVWIIAQGGMPAWLYGLCAYVALSILKIRTFLEHQAHEKARGRTVIIEDRGPLAFLFLNNNLHVVHHMHPKVPWYRLPKLYAQNKDRYVARNDGYVFRSYAQIFGRYLFSAKDPVPHPLWKPPQN